MEIGGIQLAKIGESQGENNEISGFICVFCCTFGRRLLESNSYLAMLERIFQHSPESTVAKCSPYYSSQSICAGYALAQSGNVVPSRTLTSLRSPTSKLLSPYAAHTQAFFSLKINFHSKHLRMYVFFCTFARFCKAKWNMPKIEANIQQ